MRPRHASAVFTSHYRQCTPRSATYCCSAFIDIFTQYRAALSFFAFRAGMWFDVRKVVLKTAVCFFFNVLFPAMLKAMLILSPFNVWQSLVHPRGQFLSWRNEVALHFYSPACGWGRFLSGGWAVSGYCCGDWQRGRRRRRDKPLHLIVLAWYRCCFGMPGNRLTRLILSGHLWYTYITNCYQQRLFVVGVRIVDV